MEARDAMEETPATDVPMPLDTGAVPLEDGADWVQLSSGEWLRGTLIRVRRSEVTFESDELGEQTFDLSTVSRLVSGGKKVVLTQDGRTFRGALAADEDSLWVSDEKTVLLPRSAVLSVLALDDDRRSNWAGKISVGATFRSGNTDQVDYTALMSALRETARTRWSNKYIGAISNVQDVETSNNHRISSQFDIYLTKRAFLTAPGVDVFRDRFQNIAVRVTPYVALGYQVLDTAIQTWAVSLGPALRYQRNLSSQAGEDLSDTTAGLVLSSRYQWDVTSQVDLEFNYDLTMPVPDTNQFNHNLLLGLVVDLPGDLDLNITMIWDRVNDPQVNGDGILPEPDDFRTTIGVGWRF